MYSEFMTGTLYMQSSFWVWTHKDYLNIYINQLIIFTVFYKLKIYFLEIRESFAIPFNEYLEWSLGPQCFVMA